MVLNNDKEEKNYECYFCGKKFKKLVGSTGDRHHKVSSQVKCECGNFIKTFPRN